MEPLELCLDPPLYSGEDLRVKSGIVFHGGVIATKLHEDKTCQDLSQ